MLINSHCHLDYFTDAERPEVLARAAAAGVDEMVTIGTTLAQSRTLPTLAGAQPNVSCLTSASTRTMRRKRRFLQPKPLPR